MTIIATRTLYVETETGEHPVAIRLFMPTPAEPYAPASTHWDCRYQIHWPNRTDFGRAGGNDGMHAIDTAMHLISFNVYSSPYHTARKMWWLKPWVGYGLSMPKGAREVLIGDDQRFFGLDEPDGSAPL